MSEPKNRWKELEQNLIVARDFYDSTIIDVGAYRDHAWLPALTKPDRGLGIADTLVFSMYMDKFSKLREIKESMVKEGPAFDEELHLLGEVQRRFIEPTKNIVLAAKRYGRDSLTDEEAGAITYNLIPVRVVFDFENGLDYIRFYHFVLRQQVAYLVRELRGPLDAYITSWFGHFTPGHVPEFGYINFCGVDSLDDSPNSPIMPKILSAEDPTSILVSKLPSKGLEKILEDKPKLRKEIISTIANTQTSDATQLQKEDYLKRHQCNVSATRKIFEKKVLRSYANNIDRLSGDFIKKHEEILKKEQKKEDDKAASKYII